jgi:hypothetical protein
MSHAFFLVMSGFVWEDERSRLHPITTEDLYDECTNRTRFTKPKLIQIEGLQIFRDNRPPSETQIEASSICFGIMFYKPVPRVGFINSPNHVHANGRPIMPLIHLIARIFEADIVDKSSGDEVSKFIAMVQVIWFVTQLIGRRAVHITITELEIVTAGYAVMSLVIYMLWWSKPLRVNQQIVLYSLIQEANPTPYQTPKIEHRIPNFQLNLTKIRARISLFLGEGWTAVLGLHDLNESSIRRKVGLLWAGMRGDWTFTIFRLSLLLASVYGCIHLTAWNFHFLSPPEMRLWQSTSVAITAIPMVIMVLLLAWTKVGVFGVTMV